MNTITLQAEPRTELGKTAVKKLRREGMVPTSVYYRGQSKHVTIPFNQLRKAIYTPETYIINLEIQGEGTLEAFVKELQIHPVLDDVLHCDLMQVDKDNPIIIDLPVKLVGTSEGVLAGGKLVQKARTLHVRGYYNKMPANIVVDISGLKLGRSLKVGDLSFEEFDIFMPKDVPVASVEITRALRQAAAQAAKTK